jgi:transposase
MNKKTVELQYDKNGVLSKTVDPESIKLILEEIKQGASPESILKKYKISRLETIKGWQKKYGIIEPILPKLTHLSSTTKRLLVHEILSNRISADEVIYEYKVSKNAINKWLRQYNCNKDLNMEEEKGNSEESKKDVLQELSDKKHIEELQLKILGLETMIDLAEQKFKIDIRKKSGTKQ